MGKGQGRSVAIVVVDAEEGAGEGHHLAVGYEDTGVNLPRWGCEEGDTEEGESEEAEDRGDPEL